jgi:hypothetical protein
LPLATLPVSPIMSIGTTSRWRRGATLGTVAWSELWREATCGPLTPVTWRPMP